MRYIRYAIYAGLTILLTIVSVANLQPVTLNTLPSGMSGLDPIAWMGVSVQVPLFIVVLASLLLGFVLGEVFEWLREHKHRAEARTKGAEVKKLERELKRTQAERDKDKDEVLALLDQSSSRV
ncbi:lipopolysaccharide assembly LapA domain-containing protein [Cognatishimia sp. F0-27]|uniref:LapA family protein n=1 Tax=Cognatishimia sp. F0-27 TaxID=2816855 RepID=UPI001D0C1A00|nr:LapA family protein [Cognatishimia sp. F0-27]MCC1494369.1 LapA family protein [Cognatishimia sp. F0-27]